MFSQNRYIIFRSFESTTVAKSSLVLRSFDNLWTLADLSHIYCSRGNPNIIKNIESKHIKHLGKRSFFLSLEKYNDILNSIDEILYHVRSFELLNLSIFTAFDIIHRWGFKTVTINQERKMYTRMKTKVLSYIPVRSAWKNNYCRVMITVTASNRKRTSANLCTTSVLLGQQLR